MHAPQDGLSEFFTSDHRYCDELWAAFEAKTKDGAAAAKEAWTAFDATTRLHLSLEEDVLFPAFEEATGMRGGPTEMMRHEHVQMRGLLTGMAKAFEAGDLETTLDMGDTLLMLTQQHDQKEEAMLYPMAQRALGESWSELSGVLASRLEGTR